MPGNCFCTYLEFEGPSDIYTPCVVICLYSPLIYMNNPQLLHDHFMTHYCKHILYTYHNFIKNKQINNS